MRTALVEIKKLTSYADIFANCLLLITDINLQIKYNFFPDLQIIGAAYRDGKYYGDIFNCFLVAILKYNPYEKAELKEKCSFIRERAFTTYIHPMLMNQMEQTFQLFINNDYEKLMDEMDSLHEVYVIGFSNSKRFRVAYGEFLTKVGRTPFLTNDNIYVGNDIKRLMQFISFLKDQNI